MLPARAVWTGPAPCREPPVISAPGRIFAPILRISERIFGGAAHPNALMTLLSLTFSHPRISAALTCAWRAAHRPAAASQGVPHARLCAILSVKLFCCKNCCFGTFLGFLHPRWICTRGSDASLPCARRTVRLPFKPAGVVRFCLHARRRAQFTTRPLSLLSSVRPRPAVCARVRPSGLRT